MFLYSEMSLLREVHMARKFLLFFAVHVINALRPENLAEKFVCFLVLKTCQFQFKAGLFRGRKHTSV